MKSKKVILFFSILAIFLLIAYTWYFRTSSAKNFQEFQVIRDNIRIVIQATGKADPENRLEIKPPIAGRADEILVKEGDIVKKGQILAWMSSTERAAVIDAARAKGKKELKRWEGMYRPTPVFAPIYGTIILRKIEPGQTFSSADAILIMSDRLTVRAEVDETDIAQIKVGQTAELVVDAYSEQKFEGRVDQIAFDAKPVNNVTTYVVDVLPIKTPEFLRSGMTANVEFLVTEKKDILLIPASTIRHENSKSFVLLRDEDGDPIEKEIEIGISDGKNTEVLSGLIENQIVLLEQIKSLKKNKNTGSPFGQGSSSGPSGRSRR